MTTSAETTLRLGTRKSALALAQSGQIARALEAAVPGLRVELVPRTTRGDVVRGDLAAVGGKGLFTEELERGLLDGTLDLAVHSLKDLPVTLADGLTVAAYPERGDPRDVLVSEEAADLAGLEPGAVLLTGSLRRRAQILLVRPDLVVEPLRGNVDTRLRKWRESKAAGVLLAAAGLARLGLDEVPAHCLDPELFLPAPGQGTLALETRAGTAAEALCARLNHPPTAAAALAERRVVAAFGGDCTLPLAAWAREDDGGLRLSALLATPDGRLSARGNVFGTDPVALAAVCVAALREDGADDVLARLRPSSPRPSPLRPSSPSLPPDHRGEEGADKLPLRVVVTRAEHQAEGLVEAFARAGADVAVLPLLEVVAPADPRPVERAASELALYDWLVFTSANAVEWFLPLTGGGVPSRLQVAAVGPATAEALRRWEIEPRLLAARADAEGLLADLAPRVRRRERVLLPQAADARPSLSEGLAAAGAEAVTVVAYDKRLPTAAFARARELFADASLGWVTFTSPRIVRHFVEVLGDDWSRRKGELLAASIGPVTSDALRAVGIEPAAEAVEPSDRGLAAAVVAAVIGRT